MKYEVLTNDCIILMGSINFLVFKIQDTIVYDKLIINYSSKYFEQIKAYCVLHV